MEEQYTPGRARIAGLVMFLMGCAGVVAILNTKADQSISSPRNVLNAWPNMSGVDGLGEKGSRDFLPREYKDKSSPF